MAWSWSWGIFVAALVVCTLAVMLARGGMNAQNVARHGERADFRSEPVAAIFGSIAAGAIYAAITTAVIGFMI